jgi:hypothetical protein
MGSLPVWRARATGSPQDTWSRTRGLSRVETGIRGSPLEKRQFSISLKEGERKQFSAGLSRGPGTPHPDKSGFFFWELEHPGYTARIQTPVVPSYPSRHRAFKSVWRVRTAGFRRAAPRRRGDEQAANASSLAENDLVGPPPSQPASIEGDNLKGSSP